MQPTHSGGQTDRGEYNQDKDSSQLNLANLILVDLVYLIKNGATIETKVKYGGLQPSVFTPFFTSFREIFDLTSHLIDESVADEIEEWFEKVDVRSTKSLNEDILKGLKLARKLKMEIVKLGMLRIFEPPIQPPFMLDHTIARAEEEHRTELAKKTTKTTGVKQPVVTERESSSPSAPPTHKPTPSRPASNRIPGVRNKNMRV